MKKRSVIISGHSSSVTLEDIFWDALKKIAAQNGKSVNALVSEIDETRKTLNLSSAIRIFIVENLQAQIKP